MWQTPKTDWTSQDEMTLGEFTRIYNNILYLTDTISQMLVPPVIYPITIGNYLWLSDVNKIEQDLDILKNAVGDVKGWEPIKLWTHNMHSSYTDINRWENSLLQIKLRLDDLKAALFCGNAFCGQTNPLG